MKTEKTLTNNIYCVDIRRLLIKVYDAAHHNEEVCCTTTYENFSFNKEQPQTDHLHLEHLPTIIDGVIYFKTEEEANDYVKKQMGLS